MQSETHYLGMVVDRKGGALLAYLVVAQDERRVELHWREDAGSPWRQEAAGAGVIGLPLLGGLALPLDRVYARTGV